MAGKSRLELLEDAYGRYVPREYFHLLGRSSVAEVRPDDVVEKKMTVLFSDIRNFTTLSESLTPRENFMFLNSYLEPMEEVITSCGGIIDKYIGDAIMAIFPGSAADAINAAVGMLNRLRLFNDGRARKGLEPIGTGIGLNTGYMLLGTLGGRTRMSSTVISDAVNLASRIESMTKAYEADLLISEHTYYSISEAASHDIRFADRVRVKGKEQPQSIYEVFDADMPDLREGKRQTREIFEEALAWYHFRNVTRAEELLKRCLAECPGDNLAQQYLLRCRQFAERGVHEGTGEIELSLTWSPDFEIGNKIIDSQHRKLFSAVNDFVDGMRRNEGLGKTEAIAQFLEQYAREHFETEERIMEEAGYPFLDVQIEQHRRFSDYFSILKKQIQRDFKTRRQFLLFKIQLFVMDWLVHHTVKLDGHFGRYMNARDR